MRTRALNFRGTAISTLYYEMPAKEGAHVWLEDSTHCITWLGISCMEDLGNIEVKKKPRTKKKTNEKATKCNRRKTLVAVWRLV